MRAVPRVSGENSGCRKAGYCEQYAYIYPEHLHMAGRYNSLFGLDEELVKHPEQLKAYQQAGIDRLVIGL